MLARRRAPESRDWRRPIPALVAVAVGGLAFVPWLPTFIYQSKHTGTPWALPANFAGVVNAVTGFTLNQASMSTLSTNQGRALALIYFALAALALFGIGRTGRIVELDLHTRPRARAMSFVVIGTLFAAIAGGLLTSSAFSSRYASVIFLPFLLIVALGSATLLNARGRVVLLTVAVAAGLVLSVQSVRSQRTQGLVVAQALAAHARAGDIVAFCPDQLGPATYRVVDNPAQYTMVTFPRGIGPQFVDWVDYSQASQAGNPATFASTLVHDAGAAHRIWLVWEAGYQTFGSKCEQIAAGTAGDDHGATDLGDRRSQEILRAHESQRVRPDHEVSRIWFRCRGPLREALLPFLLARVVVLGALGLAHFIVDRTHPSTPGVAARVHAGLLGWDAGWFESIAREGYGPAGPSVVAFLSSCPPDDARRGLARAWAMVPH